MSFKIRESTKCDVLVIGGGGAGLRAAIAAAQSGADVLMVSKTRIGHTTNTYLSKAIIASSGWGDPNDNSSIHGKDTLQGGRHLNNPDRVAQFAGAIPSETKLLHKWGVQFGTDKNGRPEVIKIPGHQYARHLHSSNWKGSDLVLPLKRKAMESGVRFQDRLFVSSLMVLDNRICGATGFSEKGSFLAVKAKTVILATGGFGHVFLNTNNAPGITGDGQALAWKAGVALQDMEFVQFYPTALGKHGNRLLLYEKLLTQEGVVLKNSRGEDILKKNGYPIPADITRDQLAQLIMKEIIEDPAHRKAIDMDLEGLSPETARSLSMILPAGFSKKSTVFQVVPTTHFCMGGVVVDNTGQTSCSGLFAAGEVTAGAHGANRLGGNALAEVFAMGGLVGKAAADAAAAFDRPIEFDDSGEKEKHRLDLMFKDKGPQPRELIQKLKETMWLNAGIVRSRASLDRAMEILTDQKNISARVAGPDDLIRFLEFKNMRMVAELICRSALERTESRGSHFRSDYPKENNTTWLKNIQVGKTGSDVWLKKVLVPQKGI